MFVEDCSYDEVKDNVAVAQYGYINLSECIANGAIPSSVSNTEDDYNDIEDPASIMGKPHDLFEAYRMQDYVKKNGTKSTGNKTEPVEQA